MTSDDGSCTYDVTLTVDMNCSGLTPADMLQVLLMVGLVVYIN